MLGAIKVLIYSQLLYHRWTSGSGQCLALPLSVFLFPLMSSFCVLLRFTVTSIFLLIGLFYFILFFLLILFSHVFLLS